MNAEEIKDENLDKDEKVIFVETDKAVVRDRPIKSLAKAISWRIVGTLDTMLVSFIMTGDMVIAASIGGMEVFTKILLYYLHERAWAMMRWGRVLVRIRRSTPVPKRWFNRLFSVRTIVKK